MPSSSSLEDQPPLADNELSRPLQHWVRTTPAVAHPEWTLRQAAQAMQAQDCDGLSVVDDQGRLQGVFTLRDLMRSLVQAPEARTVASAMSEAPQYLPVAAPAFEALLLMARHGISHVPLVSQERVVGLISARQLYAGRETRLVGLARQLYRAPSVAALAELRGQVEAVVVALIRRGIRADHLLRILTAFNDHTVRRVIEINREREDPGCDFTWLAFGSEGRQEQTLLTDQDNGLLFVPPAGTSADDTRARLLPFARQVNQDLARCGFKLCSGNVMAGNPELCLTAEEWKARFAGFVDDASPDNLVQASILFDWRPVYGNVQLARDVFSETLARTRKRSLFLRQMAAGAVDRRPPLTMLRRFRWAPDSDGHTLDLKRQGLRPFVLAARVMALAHGIAEPHTLGRLQRLSEQGVFSSQQTKAWRDAYNFIQSLRLTRHADQLDGQGALSNYLDPQTLHTLDRRLLKAAFAQAGHLQQALERAFQL
ncbi:DUF294 nucleotidyltransferase-like domain-containing protein [Marinobacteraceae bacterium S3BR75-40.1]